MNFGKYALLALAGVSLLAFTSCKKEETKNAPTLIIKTKADKEVGKDAVKAEDFDLFANVKVDKSLKVKELSYTVKYTKANETNQVDGKKEVVKTEYVKTEDKYVGKIEKAKIPAEAAKGIIEVVVLDSDGKKVSQTVNFDFSGVTPNPGPAPTPETGWGAEKNGAINHVNGVKSGSFDLKNGANVASQDAAKKESRYMMNTSMGEGKPFVAGWTSEKVASLGNAEGNGTKFAKVAVDYAKVTVEAAKAAFDAASPSMTVSDVAVDNVYVAVKDTEVYIIKITKVDNTNNSTRKKEDKGCIEFSYKAKK